MWQALGGDALGQLALRRAGRAEAAEIALDVGGEDRDAGIAEGFGEALQGHGLAGARGAGDQAVAVGQLEWMAERLTSALVIGNGSTQDQQGRRGHGAAP